MEVEKLSNDESLLRIHPVIVEGGYSSRFAKRAELQHLDKVLNLQPLISYTENVWKEISDSSDVDKRSSSRDHWKDMFTAEEWKEEKSCFYNFKTIGTERRWLQDLLMEDSSSDSSEITEGDLQLMLKIHMKQKNARKHFADDVTEQYAHYSSSLLVDRDKYNDRLKKVTSGNSKLKSKHKSCSSKKTKAFDAKLLKQKAQHEKEVAYQRRKIWCYIVKKEIPKVSKSRANNRGTMMQSLRKMAQGCQRERRKEALRSLKISKEAVSRGRRISREMLLYWRRFDRVEKEHRKKAEKEAMEQRRQEEEMREMKRQQRKLNFLITQTELYAHFMGRKIKGSNQDANVQNEILKKMDENGDNFSTHNGGDDYDLASMKTQALLNAQSAVLKQQKKTSSYMDAIAEKKSAMMSSFDGSFSLSEPSMEEKQLKQPKIFSGVLKTYQLKGMNWLVSLYEKGINGILADEMGLGKTVQSISFLAYLAEVHNIWGPFLIVAPASTLHNWQQEFSRFLPRFKVLPYWGDPNDRKRLRKFWNQSSYVIDSKEKAPFHVLITSYQLIVQDAKYFQRIRWQYLVLDEAQAIKSSSSIRWKILLSYNCRNRLLLTGTPIQNTMAELWALLHFIMPTLFDSHNEFNEWFSKDIEGHASEKKPHLDQNQLSRLHMILKPFMLRRIKKDVENELSEKIEIKVMCTMTSRQRQLYQAVKNKIVIEDLLQSDTLSTESKSTSLLMNLVMQFRKVCNHPELFEHKEPMRGLRFALPPIIIAKMFYRNAILNEQLLNRLATFHSRFSIWSECYIGSSIKESGCFGFLRFINLSPNQCSQLFRTVVARLVFTLQSHEQRHKFNHKLHWAKGKSIASQRNYLTREDLLIVPTHSACLDTHCITGHTTTFSTHQDCLITVQKSQTVVAIGNDLKHHLKCSTRHDVKLFYPKFLRAFYHKVCSPPVEVYCSDRSAAYHYQRQHFGTPELLTLLRSGLNIQDTTHSNLLFPPPPQGFDACCSNDGYSLVKLPDRATLTTDSGKLTVLDQLLSRLKREDHRVLIYSQMTKMIDILEEFMKFRKHSYMRLDGSSKIADRRDMVSDFQSRHDIFAFLLSTRAGGLGINLTAADTVIFYDSDWNPTVDQQAMDRAHRLGQTKQVTVYRLVTKGTIEEKILNRAKEKSEIQNIVISGGQFNKEVLKPKEVASLLLDDIELAAKLKQRQVEKKELEQGSKRCGRKRKNNAQMSSPHLKRKASDEQSESSFCDENSTSSYDLVLDESPTEISMEVPIANTSSVKKRGRGRGIGTPRGRGKGKSGSLAKAAASIAGSAARYAAYQTQKR